MKKTEGYLLKKRFECRNQGTGKFWEIEIYGDRIRTRWGRLGGTPRESVKTFSSAEDAIEEANRLEKDKLDKGYIPVSPAAPGRKKRASKKAPFNRSSTDPGTGEKVRLSKEERAQRAARLLRVIHGLITGSKLSESEMLSEFDKRILEFRALKVKYSEDDTGLLYDVIGQKNLPVDVAIHCIRSIMRLGVSKKALRERVIAYFGHVASGISTDHGKPVRLNEKMLSAVADEFAVENCASIALNIYVFEVVSAVTAPLDKNYIAFLLSAGADPNYMAKTYSGGRSYRGYLDSPTELLGRLFTMRNEKAIMKLLLAHGGRIDDAVKAGGDEGALRALI